MNPLPSPLSLASFPIGNDLVDLTRLSSRARQLDPAYLHKVCTSSERKQIHTSLDPVRSLAMHWAIKEAAYKVYVQQTRLRFFRPKAFEVMGFQSANTGQVHTPFGQLLFSIQEGSSYVHAICMYPPGVHQKWISKVIPLVKKPKPVQSNALKKRAKKQLAAVLDIPLTSLTIRSDKQGIPSLYEGPTRIPLSLSFSHDGGWGAYAFG